MSLVFALEGFKFYKLKQESVVRFLFLLCLALNVLTSYFPLGDSNLLPFFEAAQRVTLEASPANIEALYTSLTGGHLLFLLGQMAVIILNLFISYLYAAAYSAERNGEKGTKGMLHMLSAVPKLVLLLLILLIPAFLSSLLMFIPLIVACMALLFTPLLMAQEKKTLRDGLRMSLALTNSRKLLIFFAFAIQGLLFYLPKNLLLNLFSSNRTALILIGAFLLSLQTLIHGRLIGLFFYFFRVQLQGRSLDELLRKNPRELFQDAADGKKADEEAQGGHKH